MRIADWVCRPAACDRFTFVSLRWSSVHRKIRPRRRVSLPFFWVIDNEEAPAALVSINSAHVGVISDPWSCFSVAWTPRISSPASLRCAASWCSRGQRPLAGSVQRTPVADIQLIGCSSPFLPRFSRILPPHPRCRQSDRPLQEPVVRHVTNKRFVYARVNPLWPMLFDFHQYYH